MSKEFDYLKKIKDIFSKHIEEWRLMENSLSDDSLWYFLSNDSLDCELRMSIVLDIVSQKPLTCKDESYTLKYFQREIGEGSHPDYLWKKVQDVYRTLWNWSQDSEIHQKVGYLVCASYPQGNFSALSLLYRSTIGLEKLALNIFLDKIIVESQNPNDSQFLSRYRHQVNISFYRCQTMNMGTFPFDKYKTVWNNPDGAYPPAPGHVRK